MAPGFPLCTQPVEISLNSHRNSGDPGHLDSPLHFGRLQLSARTGHWQHLVADSVATKMGCRKTDQLDPNLKEISD